MQVTSSTINTMTIQWFDECMDGTVTCDDDRMAEEYQIIFKSVGGGSSGTQYADPPASQYTISGASANSDYEITIMIFGKGRDIYSDATPVVFGTSSK